MGGYPHLDPSPPKSIATTRASMTRVETGQGGVQGDWLVRHPARAIHHPADTHARGPVVDKSWTSGTNPPMADISGQQRVVVRRTIGL